MSHSTPTPAADALPDPDLTGRELGDYRILRRLGRGGMAEVYLAEQGSLRRQVALKVLKVGLARDASYVRRFHKEAQAAASLVQANIVQIYEVGRVEDLHYIAQEYVPGKNLKQVLDRQGALEVGPAVSIMRQVGAALHRAAQAGITHRDIKPENIMLTSGGEVKVADFGLARVTAGGEAVDVTQIGMTMGTPLYMSPEQIEGRSVDPRSDLYSLGITCYQMLAGHPPFSGETALSIAVQHLRNEADSLKQERPDLPEGLIRIVHKLIEKKADDRYQSAGEMLRELRGLAIESDAAEWPTGLDQWSTAEMLALSEATQQLQAVMRSEPGKYSPRGGFWRFALALVLVGFATGLAVAWVNRPESLLQVDERKLAKVPQMESPQAQYVYASWVGNERAWRSVWEYFRPDASPENAYYANLAKERLAEMHLQDDAPERALEIYKELAGLPETEEQFRMHGIAGQAICYNRLGETNEAAEKLAQVVAKRDLLTRDQREQIDRLMEQYKRGGEETPEGA
ncbi:MAG: protein kinase [Pirellulaceae bacterium]